MAETVTVRIPTALRPQVGGHEQVSLAGDSVKQVLTALTGEYPDLGKRLFKDENEINRFINVYLNDEDIRFLDNLDTPVKGGDELSLVPAIAGGAPRRGFTATPELP
ncbi:MAG: molybdopterin synthase sulfur carrier subunit [Phycisphaeraceae bacterium]|nr:molybdopterin synthase sulfur carrier subunit [Phycisphaeraceae bacterium]